MNIHNAKFLISAVDPKQYPPASVPEIAFVGRSNVGKSSLINKILNRKNFARVSSKPGKTATINFFDIDGKMNLVDLPGYGYAKVSKEEKKKWGKVIETYLNTRENLKQVILLVDSRHTPTADDITMLNFIREVCDDVVVVMTKWDKLKKKESIDKTWAIIRTFHLAQEDVLIPFSSVDGSGVSAIWAYVEELIGEEIPPIWE